MNYTEHLSFVYKECCDIIDFSEDKYIKSKKIKLDAAYNKLRETQDIELQDFYSIVHELRTYDFLKKNCITVIASNDTNAGPDFCCKELGYVECVSVTKGEGNNIKYIDECLSKDSNRYEAALSRITSKILDKTINYEKYLLDNTIEHNIPRIIAISTSCFANDVESSLIIDLMLKILYGIGSEIALFRPKGLLETAENKIKTHEYDNIGYKNRETELILDYFHQEYYKKISAIILENNALTEKIEKKYFNIFINPLAETPLNPSSCGKFQYFTRESYIEQKESYRWHNK